MTAPEWVKPGARVYYSPSGIGFGPRFAAVCDQDPWALTRKERVAAWEAKRAERRKKSEPLYVVRLRDVEAPYGKIHHGDSTRTTVKAAAVTNLEPRGVMTAAEVMREVQGEEKQAAAASPLVMATMLALDDRRALVTPADVHRAEAMGAKPAAERGAGLPMNPSVAGREQPPIVTLCGSTRFRKAFESATYRLTLEGWAVFSVGSYAREHGTEEARDALSDEQKHNLDTLHLRKIGMSQRVHVLNPGGYIGESTAGEIAYAFARGILITFLDEDAGCRWLEEHSHQLGRAIAKHAGGAR